MPEEEKRSRKPRSTHRRARRNKLLGVFMVLLAALFALAIRMYSIVKVHGADYERIVLSNQQYDTTILPYKRGDIVDSKGTILATSEKVYNMVIDASVMTTHDDMPYLEPTLDAIALYFPELDTGEIRNFVTHNETSRYYVALKRLSYSRIEPFVNAQTENKQIKGVTFEEEYKRVYPNGSLASTVLGFTRLNSNSEGQYGLEEYYDDVLSGTDGRMYGYQNDDDALERTVKDAVDGYTIHTTIDANIQGIVEKNLRSFNEQHANDYRIGNGAENLGCIVMEVNTGRVLAMANYPDYDPNDYKNADRLLGTNMIIAITNDNGYTEYRKTDTIITTEILMQMNEDEINLNLAQLWKNFTISNTFEPGSVAKPFTVAAALESGVIHDGDVYTCNGFLEVGDHKIKCHNAKIGGDGAVNVEESIAWSCNVALMKIGLKMGKAEFLKYQQAFNFGLKTNIDLAGEARTASLVYDESMMLPTDLATNSFGQNFDATMIQVITGFCSLINGGNYYEPHMVDKITNSSGATIKTYEPRVLRQTISESTSELIRRYTRATVMPEGGERRTGKSARPAGYAIGGKTGTAETLPRGNNEYVVSFIGYAPADDPQIAVYTVIDRLNSPKQDQVSLACGMVRNILTEVLPYLNIYMTEELTPAEEKELAENNLQNTLNFSTSTSSDAKDEQPVITTNVPSDTIIDSTNETGRIYPIWMTYPIDSATGYRMGPDGGYYDVYTGDPIYATGSNFLDEGVPTNPNLPQGQLGDTSGR